MEKHSFSKDDAYYMMLYQKPRESAPKFFLAIHSYIYEQIVPALKERREYQGILRRVQEKCEEDGKVYNVDGRFLFAVYQTMEDLILREMDTFFTQKGLQVDVLIYDGCLVRSTVGLDVMLRIIEECEIYIKETLDIDTKLVWKPRETSKQFWTDNLQHAVMPDEEFDLAKAARIYENCGRATFINYVNNYFCKITEDENALYGSRRTTTSRWLVRNESTFRSAYSHLNFATKKDGKDICVSIRDCVHDPRIRRFRRIEFDPTHVGDLEGEYINKFRGFKARRVDSVDMDKIQLLLEHLRVVLCAGIEEMYDYVLRWLAHIVQFPWKKTGTGPVFFGPQGCGKNIFFEFFGEKVIGPDHYSYTNSIDQITGHFNDHNAFAILLICDEVTFAGAHKQNNILKSKLTQAKQPWEKKYYSAKIVDDFKSYLFFSNNVDAVRIKDDESDRRFPVSETSDCRRGDFEYFDRLGSM